ncbi:hypothetical protein BX666DRAFT_606351 [Dichotomocladium elegans]|nr:hypothetical protein BX666DRAFT_606351 [Dichotomocladium elegans]
MRLGTRQGLVPDISSTGSDQDLPIRVTAFWVIIHPEKKKACRSPSEFLPMRQGKEGPSSGPFDYSPFSFHRMSSALAIHTTPSSGMGGSAHMLQLRSSLPSQPINNCLPPASLSNTANSIAPAAPMPTELMSRKRPTHGRTHPDRRRDCYQLLQEIIEENKRQEREEYEAMVRQAPRVIARRSPSQDLPSILVKTPPHSRIITHYPKPRARQSVRFEADPPKALKCSSGTSTIAKLRSFLHLFSD